MRHLALFVLSFSLLGCLPKQPAPAQIEGASIRLEIQSADRLGQTEAAPEAVTNAFSARVALHSSESPSAEASLEVVLSAHRFSQIQGKYRWMIEGSMHLTLGENAEQLEFSFPVFLEHPHEQEEAAMLAAIPMLERHLEQLLRQGPFSLN